jgi:hypothetical protein
MDCEEGGRGDQMLTKWNVGIMEGWNIGLDNEMKNHFNMTYYSKISIFVIPEGRCGTKDF